MSRAGTATSLGSAGRVKPTSAGPAVRLGRALAARPASHVVAFLLLSALTHVPGFTRRLWSQDEAFLGTQARVLADGGRLYVDVVDRKPPILPYLYTVAVAVADDNAIWVTRGLAVIAHAGTALLLAAIARHLWGRHAGLAAGVLYLLASVGLGPQDAQVASFEVFMLPAMVGSLYLALRGHFATAGGALAVATLTKQVAGATLLPLLLIAWRAGRAGASLGGDGSRWVPVGRLLAAYLAPITMTALIFGWDRFWFWVVTGSGEYLDASGAIPYALSRGLGNLGLIAAADLALVGMTVLAVRTRSIGAEWWLWLLSALAAVSVGLRFFGHYYLQIIPALVLIAVSALRVCGHRVWRAVLAYSLASATIFVGLGLAWPDTDGRNAHSAAVAATIRELTAPDDRVLVWGMNPEAYWLADRQPATRFITAGFLTNAGGGRPHWRVGQEYAVDGGWEAFASDVAAHPPELIVDDSAGTAYSMARMSRISQLLRDGGYVEVARTDGAVVYRRTG